MDKTKIIANYLPQYHCIPENDKWWGKGYTDWVAVQKATKLFEGHSQPRVPLGNNYYDLSQIDAVKLQAKLANNYGVYGFGIYHYWFTNDLHLLDKPALILKDNPEININYMFIWDNGSWKRTWSNVKENANDWAPEFDNSVKDNTKGILAELVYGTESDWRNHFEYLLPFFKDERYIKQNNKPVFAFFNQYNQEDIIQEMVKYWDGLAKENGFAGIEVIGKYSPGMTSKMEKEFFYEPYQHAFTYDSFVTKAIRKIKKDYLKISALSLYDYDKVWNRILSTANNNMDNSVIYGAIVGYDDSPRRGKNGKILTGASPDKFQRYLTELLQISNKQNKEYIFLTAWNEWGEGAYLEPDEENGYAYLEALKRAVDSVNEEDQ